jgi:anti-sigma B factor antagonist
MTLAAAPNLTIVTRLDPHAAVVVVHGEVDLATAPQLRDAALRALAVGAGNLHLDLTGVTFMDSAGLHVLLATRRRARLTGGHLALCGTSRCVDRLLELTGTASILGRQDPQCGPGQGAAAVVVAQGDGTGS